MSRFDPGFIDYAKSNTMDPDSTFQFTCRECGGCCRRRSEPVLLTGIDVLNIARATQMPPAKVLEKYTVRHIGEHSNLPVLALREREYDGSCSLLRKGRCSIQSQKPIVCRLFPLGRYYDPQTKTSGYFPNREYCGMDGGKTWSLEEWLTAFDIHRFDDDTRRWHEIIVRLAEQTAKETRRAVIERTAGNIAHLLYLDYDYSSPLSYGGQLDRNIRRFFGK